MHACNTQPLKLYSSIWSYRWFFICVCIMVVVCCFLVFFYLLCIVRSFFRYTMILFGCLFVDFSFTTHITCSCFELGVFVVNIEIQSCCCFLFSNLLLLLAFHWFNAAKFEFETHLIEVIFMKWLIIISLYCDRSGHMWHWKWKMIDHNALELGFTAINSTTCQLVLHFCYFLLCFFVKCERIQTNRLRSIVIHLNSIK